MNEKKASNKKKVSYEKIIIIFAVLAVVCIAIVIAGQQVIKQIEGQSPERQAEAVDEIKRAKDFVTDWYAEITETGDTIVVYLNELKKSGSNYTLTYFDGRVRAVYPRGERFFKFYVIDKIEFFEVTGKTRCRFYYFNGEEFTFSLEKN